MNTVVSLYGMFELFFLGQANLDIRICWIMGLEHSGLPIWCFPKTQLSPCMACLIHFSWAKPIAGIIILLDHRMGTQWSLCMVFPKHSCLPVWHVSLNSLSVRVLYIFSRAGERILWTQIGCPGIPWFRVVGLEHSGHPVWCFPNTVVSQSEACVRTYICTYIHTFIHTYKHTHMQRGQANRR